MMIPIAHPQPNSKIPGSQPAREKLSLVIPVFNEMDSLKELHEILIVVLRDLNRPCEIIFVDDGSSDDSARILASFAASDPRVIVISFRRNFGKAAALDAAFQVASGGIVVTMDGDLQDDPREIPRFLAKLDEGYDVVSGWKKVRHDPVSKTLPSRVFNSVVRTVFGLKLHDFNCGFKGYRAEVLGQIRLYGDLHRFVPVLAHWGGFRVTEIPVRHHPRRFGQSKFGAQRFLKGFFDLLTVMLTTKFRSRPLHFFGYVATIIGVLGASGLGYLFIESILGVDALRPRPLLYLSMLFVLTAVQLLGTGLLGELMKSLLQGNRQDYQIRSNSLSKNSAHTFGPGALQSARVANREDEDCA